MRFLILIFILFISSCSDVNKKTLYKYHGIEILRVDQSGKTTFYYKNKDGKTIDGSISIKYAGINDGFSGYLQFNDDDKVEILVGEGDFKKNGADRSLFIYRDIPLRWQLKSKKNIYEIIRSTKYEKDRNSNINTEVQVEYEED